MMKRNKDGWIFVTWLSLAVMQVEIMYVRSSWNWFEAQKLCEENNDRLPNPRTISPQTGNQWYWSSQYTRFSFWIKILGCYNDTSPDVTESFHMDISSAGFCQEICAARNSSSFGIKQNECKCFGKLSLELLVSPDYCNTVRNIAGGIKFADRGGANAYTLYESDFNVTKRYEIYYVAVECNTYKRFYFVPLSRYSLSYRAVCQNSVSESYQNWTSSMELCKAEHSSYLAGNVSLDDVDETCDRLNVTLTGPSWLGVANELYAGYDRGVPINYDERKSFLQCVMCNGEDCVTFVDCRERVGVVYCEKGFSIGATEHSTTTTKPGTTQSNALTSETFITFTTSFPRNYSVVHTDQKGVTDSSNTLRVVIPVVVTIIFIGCFATAAVFFIRRKRYRGKQSNKHLYSKDMDISYVNMNATNTDYVVLKPHSATTYDELHVQKDESNLYEETAERMYDQVG